MGCNPAGICLGWNRPGLKALLSGCRRPSILKSGNKKNDRQVRGLGPVVGFAANLDTVVGEQQSAEAIPPNGISVSTKTVPNSIARCGLPNLDNPGNRNKKAAIALAIPTSPVRSVKFGIGRLDRKSTRLNSSHLGISYA